MKIIRQLNEAKEQLEKALSERNVIEQNDPATCELLSTIADAQSILLTAQKLLESARKRLSDELPEYDEIVQAVKDSEFIISSRTAKIKEMAVKARLNGAGVENVHITDGSGYAIVDRATITGWSIPDVNSAFEFCSWLSERGMSNAVEIKVTAESTGDGSKFREFLFHSSLWAERKCRPPVDFTIDGDITIIEEYSNNE